MINMIIDYDISYILHYPSTISLMTIHPCTSVVSNSKSNQYHNYITLDIYIYIYLWFSYYIPLISHYHHFFYWFVHYLIILYHINVSSCSIEFIISFSVPLRQYRGRVSSARGWQRPRPTVTVASPPISVVSVVISVGCEILHDQKGSGWWLSQPTEKY